MALVTCPECQTQVSDQAAACPTCGFPMRPVTPGVLSVVSPQKAAPVPHHCPTCGDGFQSSRQLYLHRVNEHGHSESTASPASGGVPSAHPCPECGKGFDTRLMLYKHRESVHLRKPASGGWLSRPKVTCPHCGATGKVATRPVKAKKGISGGKATGALLTGGFSLLATGLSRKETVTQAHCGNCQVTWTL